MHGISICEICKKEYKWRKRNCDKPPRFCSRVCRKEFGHIGFRPGGQIRMSELTEEEKTQRLKKYYEKYVIKQNGCWDWKGIIEHTGYAVLAVRPPIKAQRASWIIHKGEIPKGLLVCHACDNPKCTNPDHLWLGTHKENIQDRVKKGRSNTQKGSRLKVSKIDEIQALEIKKLLITGMSCAEIGRKYSLSIKIISRIKNVETWKHVEIK